MQDFTNWTLKKYKCDSNEIFNIIFNLINLYIYKCQFNASNISISKTFKYIFNTQLVLSWKEFFSEAVQKLLSG